jgi:hypothetical protein
MRAAFLLFNYLFTRKGDFGHASFQRSTFGRTGILVAVIVLELIHHFG